MIRRLPATPLAVTLAAILLAGLLLSLVTGPVALPASQSLLSLLDALGEMISAGTRLSTLEDYQQRVVTDLRLPRALLALLTGAILAQCGAVMQGLFRNPLADPGIVGVSSGAALGAMCAILFFSAANAVWATPLLAFTGGLITTLLVYQLARSSSGTSVVMLLLAGIAFSAIAQALVGFASYFSDDAKLRAMSLWQMGSVTGANRDNLLLSLITCIALMLFYQRQATALNALLLGEAEARHLGIDVERLKWRLIIGCAIGVGIAVAHTGLIGFVGLVVPHAVRMLTGPDHRTLLPLSALCGALLMLLADLAARTLVQPAELPVGLLTALLGAPFFLFLLLQQRRQWLF